MLGFTKTEWQGIHTIFTFLFVIAGVFHIYYNWKPLLKYFADKLGGVTSVRSELIAALVFSVAIFAGTYFRIPPFSTLLDFGEEITDSWSNETNEPPIPHAEELTLPELAKQLNSSTIMLINKLQKYNVEVKDSLTTLKILAERYDKTPSNLYNIIKTTGSNKSGAEVKSEMEYRSGSGYGRMMISKVFKDNNLTWEEGLEMLKKYGIFVSEDAKLKDIATENKKLPIDIINYLKKD
jgi:transcriptional regulator CtsR